MSENSEDEIRELYQRFKNELREHPGDMFYDEDDLVMVFDVAGDYHDGYVQLNVLTLGRRLYPDSEQLELRTGFLMVGMGDGATFDDFLARNSHRQGLLWDLLRLRCSGLKYDPASEQLEHLLDTYTLDEDEDIIQFVNLVADTYNEKWLERNYKRVVERSKYPDTALSECADVIKMSSPAVAIEAVEQLTRIDPFNVNSWILLAEYNLDVENAAEGMAAVEYALAIDPANAKARYLQAQLLMLNDETSPQAVGLLENLMRDEPDMSTSINEVIAGDYRDEEELGQSISHMLRPDWEYPDMPLRILTAYDETRGLYLLAGEYIKLLYKQDKLYELCRFMERERADDCPEMRLDPPSLPLYAASLLRLRRYAEAEATAREYLQRAGEICTNTELSMAFAGVKIALNYILEQARLADWTFTRDPVAEALS